MTLREVRPVGLAHLELVTRLLQEARLAEPYGGLWEAADVQWWWREDQRPEPEGQPVWFRGEAPVVAAVFTRWKDGVGCDLLGRETELAEHSDLLWRHVGRRFTDHKVSMEIHDHDAASIAAAERAGFAAGDEAFVTGWMHAADRPAVPALPAGFRIEPYGGGAHPMARRNGPSVAERLAECSLYRPDLDLSIREGDAVAGYALFWADPVTRVGLLEPMRIEDEYQGRRLSKALVAEGMRRLAAAGCTRLKVTWHAGNEPAARLYTGAGYRPRTTSRTWTRLPTAPP